MIRESAQNGKEEEDEKRNMMGACEGTKTEGKVTKEKVGEVEQTFVPTAACTQLIFGGPRIYRTYTTVFIRV